ncbi:MAG: fasciclin domain-containing protein [Tychonema bourrellyi B0820]|uniref:Beta-Ig-H3/fasciclin n=1 Tax=Tychonema bourrellyi FEM_GT703 TaxID=2040638 RepID=A0A2G4EV59_9CYAN|nr:fasciclin domain-containing protein [Tychonema bourrellyi]MDQ2100565.1 fasciclin domain-containing protein [Tychonema bourrellyi B0820]PHX53368.1 beta-Ig-H3/fasciclin [Tychonema bourrellyi FEM_GT703]
MKNSNLPSWMKQLTGFAGVIGASALIGFPAWAHINANTSVANAATTQQVAGNAKTAASPAPTAQAKDIVAIASGDPQFKTLTTALKAAGLVQTLQGKGPFTVFAPTDAAFAALPKGTLEDLLKPANKAKLTKILTYHVVSGSVLSTSLKSGDVPTVEKSPVKVVVSGGKVTVGGANVVKADIKASNGVIHVIDKVLIPGDAK